LINEEFVDNVNIMSTLLKQMKEIGFDDERNNVRALVQSQMNLNLAIEILQNNQEAAEDEKKRYDVIIICYC